MTVVLHHEQDKKKIQNNLQNLKGISECKGASINEDYTISEKQINKNFLIKLGKKNSLEVENSNFV